MDPTAFTVFGIEIKWYAIIITSAMILGVYLTMNKAKKQGFEEDHILDIAIVALPLAIICARAYYVLFNLEMYTSITEMINIRLGGMAIHGGLIGGFLGGYMVTKYRKMNTLKVMDLVAPYLILAQAIGRWGNYVNQEAHGGPTNLPWGIMVNGVKVHPTFLYESLWNMIVFFILIRVDKHKKYDGQIVGLYLILYSAGRFFIEGLRTDSLMVGPLRTAQLISIVMIIGGIILMRATSKKGIKPSYAIKTEASEQK